MSAAGSEGIDIGRGRRTNDLTERVVFLDYHDNVVNARYCGTQSRLQFFKKRPCSQHPTVLRQACVAPGLEKGPRHYLVFSEALSRNHWRCVH